MGSGLRQALLLNPSPSTYLRDVLEPQSRIVNFLISVFHLCNGVKTTPAECLAPRAWHHVNNQQMSFLNFRSISQHIGHHPSRWNVP